MQTLDCCSLHPLNVLSYFCEQCEEFICILCKIRNHSSHTVLTLSAKREQLEKNLKTFKRKKFKFHILKKLEDLKIARQSVENDVEDVKNKISSQHESVMRWLSEIYEHQIDAINNALNDELNRFDTVENKLEGLIKTRKSLKYLIEPSQSRTLLQQCEDLMLAQKKISTKMDGVLRKPKYIEPKRESFVNRSEEMFAFLTIHILGYCEFQSVENAEIGYPECGFPPAPTSFESPALNWENPQLDYLTTEPFTVKELENLQTPVTEEIEKRVCDFSIFLCVI